ncbi:MAG TPA: hypothetical protein VFX12_11340 [Vicinamibacterales bacterium]|nr:hypothetical protein [Vicinamibacterales bacterium]
MTIRTAAVSRLALAAWLALLPASAAFAQGQGQANGRTSSLTVPVTAVANGAAATGTFTLQRFEGQGTNAVAVGTLVAKVTDPATTTTRTIVTQIALPVDLTQSTASCPILHLVLGPLDLNLLGLAVHLDQVVLDITAVQGPGNLLGNLLCAVSNLLNGTASPVSQLVGLLNQILAALG